MLCGSVELSVGHAVREWVEEEECLLPFMMMESKRRGGGNE